MRKRIRQELKNKGQVGGKEGYIDEGGGDHDYDDDEKEEAEKQR